MAIKEVDFDNSNLTLKGFGRDVNGNAVIKLAFPNGRGFSIQTNGNLPLAHRTSHIPLAELISDADDWKMIQSEVVNYIKDYGTANQVAKLKIRKVREQLVKEEEDNNMKKTVIEERDGDNSLGYVLTVGNEYIMKDNAHEDGIDIDWDRANEDISIIESNILKLMRKAYGVVTDEGHDSDSALIGAVFPNTPEIFSELNDVVDYEPLRTGAGTFPFDDRDFMKGTSGLYDGIIDVDLDFFDPQGEWLEEKIENSDIDKKILSEAVDVMKIINDLAKSFGSTNEDQGRMSALIKGLAFSDEPEANTFMKKLDKCTTEISKEMTADKKDKKKKESLISEFPIRRARPSMDIYKVNDNSVIVYDALQDDYTPLHSKYVHVTPYGNEAEGDVRVADGEGNTYQVDSNEIAELASDGVLTLVEAKKKTKAKKKKMPMGKCPICGNKYLKQTGYCVSCQKKVKESQLELSDGITLTMIKDTLNEWHIANEVLNTIILDEKTNMNPSKAEITKIVECASQYISNPQTLVEHLNDAVKNRVEVIEKKKENLDESFNYDLKDILSQYGIRAVFENYDTKTLMVSESYTKGVIAEFIEETIAEFIEETIVDSKGKLALLDIQSEDHFNKKYNIYKYIPNIGLSIVKKK